MFSEIQVCLISRTLWINFVENGMENEFRKKKHKHTQIPKDREREREIQRAREREKKIQVGNLHWT